jgi:hypothetical protein
MRDSNFEVKVVQYSVQIYKQCPDVEAVLKQLQRASRENRLPAFQRCVERGVVKI